MRFELSLDAVKRIIFENWRKDNKDTDLLDKDYKIWYNYNTQTITLEHKNAQTSTKESSIPSNLNRIHETD